MEDHNAEPSAKPKKSPFGFKRLVLYSLAIIGLAWLGIQGYWGFFKIKLWLAGFGTGAFWILGSTAGFIYFYAVHRIYERIKEMPRERKRIGAYTGLSVGLLIANPLPLSLAVWLFTPPGSLKLESRLFFIGCSVATGIVLLLERLFAKKQSKIQN